MKVPLTSQRTIAAVNMTPMIDVVFLLIIFFLVSSHLAQRETRMPLDLPAAVTHQAHDGLSNRMTINISQNGQIQLGTTTVDVARAAWLLVKHQNEHGSAAGVRIRSDKTVPYGVVESLLREITTAGIVDISFAVREEM